MTKNTIKGTLSVVFLAVGLLALLAFSPLGTVLRLKLGMFDPKHFDAVVDQVRTMPPLPGEDQQLRLDDPSDPTSLRKLKMNETFLRGDGAGNVWARITSEGKLTVVIQTKDKGHGGEYGFAYSDAPLTPKSLGGSWSHLDVPGKLTVVQPDMRIDDRWWKVLNNLD